MQFGKIVLSSSLLFTMALNAAAMTHARRGPTSPHVTKHKSSSKPAGQRSIDSERTTQIQAALIKAGYLRADKATGTWDTQTSAAMEKLQADNGWQTKLVPDSRAIIKLGLGPTQDNIALGQ
jgi:peptidoglycan hydrolase-like protein with peptidoglycan-binding domain